MSTHVISPTNYLLSMYYVPGTGVPLEQNRQKCVPVGRLSLGDSGTYRRCILRGKTMSPMESPVMQEMGRAGMRILLRCQRQKRHPSVIPLPTGKMASETQGR